jgi:methionyl aminopeptidase
MQGITDDKYAAMKTGGKIMAQIFKDLRNVTKVGVNEKWLDKYCEKKILEYGAEVAYYEDDPNFPGAICISVNDELIHGVPEDRDLEDGDKISFDLVIKYQGYYVDSAFTMVVGNMSSAEKNLLKVTEASLYAGIDQVKPGARLGDVGHAVERTLKKGGLGVIVNYVGHGIGEKMHMPPEVPNFGKKDTGEMLKPGDIICIEPMSSMGKVDTRVGNDGWTVFLRDGSLGAHFEHTVLVTEDGYEILTQS